MNFLVFKATFAIAILSISMCTNAGELDDAFVAFNNAKYDSAFPVILKAAQSNNPKAQGLTARMYGNGWGVAKDEKEAYIWASKGVLKDDPASQSVIGYMYLYGLGGLNKDSNEAIKWYKKSAEQNYLLAINSLAQIFNSQKNFSEEINYLNKAFLLGDSSAANRLSFAYDANPKVPDHHIKAIDWLKKGATAGNVLSMEYLGDVYNYGFYDVEIDKKEAFKWYLLCTEKDNFRCESMVSAMYMKGEGVSKDFSKGMSYLQKGVKAGDDGSTYQLGMIALLGLYGAKEDHVRGYDLMRKLQEKDSYLGYELESFVYEFGIDRPKNSQKAILLALTSVQMQEKSNGKSQGLLSTGTLARQFTNDKFQLPEKYRLAWFRFGLSNTQSQSDLQERKSYESALSRLDSADRKASEAISFKDLVSETKKYLEGRREQIGPIEPRDLVDEGWAQFVGRRGRVNEPLAQYLTEEGLRLAIRLHDDVAIAVARNNLGAILDGSANSNVRNHRLAQVHLYDGSDSRFGPSNLLTNNYVGNIKLSKEEVAQLSKRFQQIKGAPHPTTDLPQLPDSIKENSNAVIEFLVKIYRNSDKRNPELANMIASLYEDQDIAKPNFKAAGEWYSKIGSRSGEERYKRTQLIEGGKYEDKMPNFSGTLYSLFEVDLVDTRSGFLTSLDSAISKQLITNKNKSGKLKLYALVIGNSNYKDRPLKNSLNDSRAISTKLRSLGFNVTELENLDRRKFKEAVISFSEKAKDSDVTLLFYSGHGIQLGGINYLLPVDIDFNGSQDAVTYDGFSLNDIRNRNLPGATKLIFLDACRTNPFKSSATRGAADEGLAPVNVSTGTIISYATRDGGVAYDAGSGNNSPYTQSLLKHLDDDEDVEIMLRSVRDNVVKLTQNKQEPWKYGSLSGGKVIISKLDR